TVYVEKYVLNPRHIEIQVIADQHGQTVYLGERECSIQRRHQKIMEETPSPVVTPEIRERMGTAAVRAVEAAGYVNAGTVEFIFSEGDFYFLEVNARLQVEHPITEQVTGVDLVRAQLDVASGKPLPWTQDALRQRGHAIEVRVYAEDPDDRFLPQSGTIAVYSEPTGPGVRVDAGVTRGSEIGVKFDPMLAKLVATAESRDAAIDRLARALRDYVILGTKTNVSWLRRVITHPAFREGLVSTRFLEEHAESLAPRVGEVVPRIAAAIASAPRKRAEVASSSDGPRLASVWDELGMWGRAT
ncbi:MAG: 3-methylcrotonyl-CoA carboxylase, partial [Acidobacteria bacterium]|nr:3-methylcrotonyl-CoA carboxylase [Acidobacteriota bacterium]